MFKPCWASVSAQQQHRFCSRGSVQLEGTWTWTHHWYTTSSSAYCLYRASPVFTLMMKIQLFSWRGWMKTFKTTSCCLKVPEQRLVETLSWRVSVNSRAAWCWSDLVSFRAFCVITAGFPACIFPTRYCCGWGKPSSMTYLNYWNNLEICCVIQKTGAQGIWFISQP